MGKSFSRKYGIGRTYTLAGYLWLVVREYTDGGIAKVDMKCLGKSFANDDMTDKYKAGEIRTMNNPIGRIYSY